MSERASEGVVLARQTRRTAARHHSRRDVPHAACGATATRLRHAAAQRLTKHKTSGHLHRAMESLEEVFEVGCVRSPSRSDPAANSVPVVCRAVRRCLPPAALGICPRSRAASVRFWFRVQLASCRRRSPPAASRPPP